MKKHLLLTLAILFLSLTSAQAQFVNYENDYGWNLGINIGGVWQQNDFDYTPKGGISGGLTFGKSIYEKEGAFFAFDLRYRYLGGWNRGYATDTSEIALDTVSFLGYQNYRLAIHEHTLEGVITLNRLRESTGILLYGFGGLGLTNYSVKANYEDGIFGDYNYLSIDNAQSPNEIVNDLDRMLDNSYETTIKEKGTDFMPSLGFGIGYQFPYHFSMGLEHKITYALADNKLNGMPNGLNDKYHYSAMYFRWNLFGSGNENYTVNSSGNVNSYTPAPANEAVNTPTGNKPLVNITNPSANNTTFQNSAQTISANIYYVETKEKVLFKQNGIQLSNFNYNSNTNHFDASVILQPGNNVFEIVGSNAYGSDQDSKILLLQNPVEVVQPPIVTITNPPYCPFIVTSSQFILTSTVLNIDNANQITFTFNGINSANFSYNISTKVFSSGLTLKEGNNTIQITATNSQGSVTKTCTINYTAVNALPPIVDITFPVLNPFNTTKSLVNINATVKNVTLKNQIKVYVNGAIQQAFVYNSGTKQVSFPANLIVGTNVIQISASNADGYDSESTTIIYTKPQKLPPPVVTFVNPSVSLYTIAVSNMNIKATVLNVNSKPGISVKHNGSTLTNFSFSPVTKLVSFNANLVIGSNVFEIKGTNTVGSDAATATIIYKIPLEINPPVVTITKPSVTPYMVNFPTQSINATILNVNNANNVTAVYNGVTVSNFIYDPATTEFSYSASLLEGANTLLITGTNVAGTASKTQTVIYDVPPCEKPTLTQVSPAANPYATSNSKGYLEYSITNATSVEFNINGQSSPGFNFNQATGKFTSMLHLTEGATSYEVIATNSCGSTSQMTAIIYEEELPCYEPTISFINPSVSPFEHIGKTGNTSFNVSVENITNENMILVTLNGSPVSFTYNSLTGHVAGAVSLIEGSNTVSISATNECGNTTSETIITYAGVQDQLPPPLVTITAPNTNPYPTSNSTETITATVLNVAGVNGISAIFNGVPTTNFSYNSTSKVFSYSAPLISGLNSLIISGTNTVGTDSKTQTITKAEPCLNPKVRFAEPTANANGYTSFFATVGNIINSNLIFVSHNGSTVPFTYDAATGKVSVTLTLLEGNNLIGISASNACGSALSEHNIMYTAPIEVPCLNPLITILSLPMSNGSQYNFTAAVSNVLSSSNVSVNLNGTVVSSNYNANTGSLLASLTLVEGNNTVVVNANECDGATETLTVVYTVPCDPVTYNLILPNGNSATTAVATYMIKINTENVPSNTNISVTLNGNSIPFTFNPNSGMIDCSNIPLQVGVNPVVVTIGNDCSNETISYNITYEEPIVVPPPCENPTISLSSTGTSSTAAYNLAGTIANITDVTNVAVTLNGSAITSNFNINSGNLTSSLTLVEGNNTVVVNANECDGATETLTVVYTVPCDPVTYNLILPNGNSATTAVATYMIKINTENVPSNTNISVTLNGNSIPFTFNPNSGMIDCSNIPLQVGVNPVVVTIGNDCSNETISYNITYEEPIVVPPPCENPTISLSSTGTSSTAAYNLAGTIANITDVTNVAVTLNGSAITSNFNINSGNLTSSLTLVEGNNTVVVNANECDGATETLTVVYTVPCDPVTYNLILPNGNSATTAVATYMIKINTENVPSNTNISVTLNGNSIPFTFNPNSGMIDCSNIPLQVGVNPVVVTIGNDCSNETISYNITYEEPIVVPPPCENPTISLSSTGTSSTAAYNLAGTIANITDVTNVAVTLNGSAITSNFNINSGNLTSSLTLVEGNNTVVVNANECDGATETLTVVYTVPCDPVTYNLILPNGNSATTAVATYMIKINTENVSDSSNITTTLNGGSIPFIFDPNSGMISCSNIALEEGDNPLVVTMGNSCSDETIYYTITYEAPVIEELTSCGPRFNPGNADWQFCLVTPSGTYNREDLASNSNFNYSGPATSVYFKPIAGGGDAIVNGQPYSVQNGQYYLFQGGLTVDVSSSHPGSMGHWEICVNSNSIPTFGNGNNRPASPCENKSATGGGNQTEMDAGGKAKEAAEKKAKEDLDVAYNSAIQKADMYYNSKKWSSAKQYYNQASVLKPNEGYPKNKIEKLEALLKTEAQKKADAAAAAKAKSDAAAKAKSDAAAKAKSDAAAKAKSDAAAKAKAAAAAKAKAAAAAKAKSDAAAKAKAAAAAKAKAAAAAKAKAAAAAKAKAAAAAKAKAAAAAKAKSDAAAKAKSEKPEIKPGPKVGGK